MKKIKLLYVFICFTSTIFCQNIPLTQQQLKKQNIFCFTLYNSDTNSIDKSILNFTDFLNPNGEQLIYNKNYSKLYDSF